MAEYIEREAAIESIMSEPPDAHYPHWYADKIKAIPAADVAPVRHGQWIEYIEIGAMNNHYECSSCHWKTPSFTIARDSNFYPNCGAKMDL